MAGLLHSQVLIGSGAGLVPWLHAEGLNHGGRYPRGQYHTTQGALCLHNGPVLQELPWHLHTGYDLKQLGSLEVMKNLSVDA